MGRFRRFSSCSCLLSLRNWMPASCRSWRRDSVVSPRCLKARCRSAIPQNKQKSSLFPSTHSAIFQRASPAVQVVPTPLLRAWPTLADFQAGLGQEVLRLFGPHPEAPGPWDPAERNAFVLSTALDALAAAAAEQAGSEPESESPPPTVPATAAPTPVLRAEPATLARAPSGAPSAAGDSSAAHHAAASATAGQAPGSAAEASAARIAAAVSALRAAGDAKIDIWKILASNPDSLSGSEPLCANMGWGRGQVFPSVAELKKTLKKSKKPVLLKGQQAGLTDAERDDLISNAHTLYQKGINMLLDKSNTGRAVAKRAALVMRDAVDAMIRAYGEGLRELALVYSHIARAYRIALDYNNAIVFIELAVAQLSEDSIERFGYALQQARIHTQFRCVSKAQADLEKLQKLARRHLDPRHVFFASIEAEFGRLYYLTDQIVLAKEHYDRVGPQLLGNDLISAGEEASIGAYLSMTCARLDPTDLQIRIKELNVCLKLAIDHCGPDSGIAFMIYSFIAELQLARMDFAGALATTQTALQVAKDLGDTPELLEIQISKGRALHGLDRFDDAVTSLQHTRDVVEQYYGGRSAHSLVGDVDLYLGLVYLHKDKASEAKALTLLSNAVKLNLAKYGEPHVRHRAAVCAYAAYLYSQGHYEVCRGILSDELSRYLPGSPPPHAPQMLLFLVLSSTQLGDHATSEYYALEVSRLAISIDTVKRDEPESGTYYATVAAHERKTQNLAGAKAHYETAMKRIMESSSHKLLCFAVDVATDLMGVCAQLGDSSYTIDKTRSIKVKLAEKIGYYPASLVEDYDVIGATLLDCGNLEPALIALWRALMISPSRYGAPTETITRIVGRLQTARARLAAARTGAPS
eukprot:m.221802 g.221802  ORF g.221802 m.221802 type:complete len:866 (-) comp10655_c0_seq1:61-2658(-)